MDLGGVEGKNVRGRKWKGGWCNYFNSDKNIKRERKKPKYFIPRESQLDSHLLSINGKKMVNWQYFTDQH